MNPRLGVAQLRLAAQQGQQHPLEALIQGGMRGIQFAQNIHQKKAQLAQQAAHLRMLAERNKLEQRQFEADLKFKQEQEKRAQDLHTQASQKHQEWLKEQPGRQKMAEMEAGFARIRNAMARNQMERAKAEQEARQRMGAQLARHQIMPKDVTIGGAVMPQMKFPGMPAPQPQNADEIMALRQLQAPQTQRTQALEDQQRTFQQQVQLLQMKHGQDLELLAMKTAKDFGLQERIQIEVAKSAVKTVLELAAAEQLQKPIEERSDTLDPKYITILQKIVGANLTGQPKPTPTGGPGNKTPGFDESRLDRFRR